MTRSTKAMASKSSCCATPRKGARPDTGAYVELCKALGDETRLAMLASLAACRGELCACEIEDEFDLSQPTISHHLKVLREAGLVRGERRGTWIYYEIDERALARLKELAALLGNR